MTLDDLTVTQQQYLEAIHAVADPTTRAALVKDIAEKADVKPPSVIEAIARLKDAGLVTQEPRTEVILTDEGWALAEQLAARHATLHDFFSRVLRIPAEDAEKDACKVEHALSPMTFGRLCDFLEHIDSEAIEYDKTVPLTMMNKGEKGVLMRIAGGEGKHARLAAMGVRIKEHIEVLQNVRGGPVMVRVGNARIAIGRMLATCLHIKPSTDIPPQ